MNDPFKRLEELRTAWEQNPTAAHWTHSAEYAREMAKAVRQVLGPDGTDALLYDQLAEHRERQEQIRADRHQLAMWPHESAKGSRVYVAPQGTPIGAPEWTELGYLSEDGLLADTRPIPETWDPYWGNRPHRDYGLPDIDLKTSLRTHPRRAGKATAPRALADILERNPAAAAEHRRKL